MLLLLPLLTFGSTLYDSIAIIIDNRIITKNEIELRVLEEASRQRLDLSDKSNLGPIRDQITNLLIEESLLDIRADELQIHLSDEALEAEISNFRRQNNLSQVEFENYLEKQQLSLPFFRRNYKKRYLRSKVIDREIRPYIQIDEADLESNYSKDQSERFSVRARHILIKLSPNATSEERRLKENKLLKIKKEIESGLSFSKAADLYSEDPSAKINHGDLGFFEKTDMVKEFSEEAFSLPIKKISDPVLSPFGFHLIEVLEKKQVEKKSFQDAKDSLFQQRYQALFVSKYQEYIKNLKGKAQIKFINP
ncbi:MAG: peptidylprolyl isomerase [Deltaproteobacteria bacterium]|nr:peptidylprolyl isomerase [Deltaproteobacteria bacterium]